MADIARLSGCSDWLELDFVEHERTPTELMRLGIRLHLAGLSLSNTVTELEEFGVQRSRKAIHDWVQNADSQPATDASPDQIAVDETVIHIDGQQYWLYAAVDPETNELLHTKLEPTRTNAIARSLLADLREKYDVDDGVFLVDGAPTLKDAYQRHGHRFQYENMGIGMLSNVSFEI